MSFSPQRKKRLARTSGIVALIVAIVVTLVVKCSGSDAPDDSSESKKIGQGVTATSKKLPKNIVASVRKDQSKPYLLGAGLSPVLSVAPSGALAEPVTLNIPLQRKVAKDTSVFVVVNHSHKADGWHILQSRLGTDRQHVSVTTSHFSWFWVFTLDSAATSKTFQQDVTDALSGEIRVQANKPECKDQSKAKSSNYQVASSAKDTLYWCFGIEDGKRLLKVVNRQRYPLNVHHKGFKVLSAGHIQAEITQLARWGSGDITILYPRDEAVMQLKDLPEGGKATISTEFSGWAEALYNVDIAFESTVSIMVKFGFKDIGVHTSKYWEYLDKMLSTKSCVNAAANRNLGKMVSACFRNFLSDPYGKIGSAILFSALDAVLLVGNWFTSQLQSTYDNITNYDEYSIVVSRPAGTPLTFHDMIITLQPRWQKGNVYASKGLGVQTTGRCMQPSFCEGFMLFDQKTGSQGAAPTYEYNPNYPWNPSNGADGCMDKYKDGIIQNFQGSPTHKETVLVGGHGGTLTEWKGTCLNTNMQKLGTFTQRVWYLPTEKIFVVDEWNTPGLYDALKDATWQ